jgi:hypothetical protein
MGADLAGDALGGGTDDGAESGADDIEPGWSLGAADDRHRIVRDPDPKSRVGYVRIIGLSPGAGFVLTVIADPEDWSGVTAWKTAARICGSTSTVRRVGDG